MRFETQTLKIIKMNFPVMLNHEYNLKKNKACIVEDQVLIEKLQTKVWVASSI